MCTVMEIEAPNSRLRGLVFFMLLTDERRWHLCKLKLKDEFTQWSVELYACCDS